MKGTCIDQKESCVAAGWGCLYSLVRIGDVGERVAVELYPKDLLRKGL